VYSIHEQFNCHPVAGWAAIYRIVNIVKTADTAVSAISRHPATAMFPIDGYRWEDLMESTDADQAVSSGKDRDCALSVCGGPEADQQTGARVSGGGRRTRVACGCKPGSKD